jgi:hypothetical protein
MNVHRIGDVFGISRDIPENYIERPLADEKLIANLTRDKHIVIYGSSKQGKTSLRKHCLEKADYVVVQCSNKWAVEDIHNAILKQVGFEITQSSSTTISGKAKINAKLGFALLKLADLEVGREKTVTKQELELDPSDVNDIIKALKSINFDRYIVLEDFHYLPLETQKDFSIALKAFHENSRYCFIVVGVWLEENRLITFNGDLDGRIASINADQWSKEELLKVVNIGEVLLNIKFDKQFLDELLADCFSSVYIVQEVCHKACERSGIIETKVDCIPVGGDLDAKALIKEVVDNGKGRFNSFINHFAEGFQTTELQMYRWMLHPILTSDVRKLERGITFSAMRSALQKVHPQGKNLNAGNVHQALNSCASLQVKKGIKPIILDYDSANTVLNVVDRSFLIWLARQNRQELLEIAGLDPGQTS